MNRTVVLQDVAALNAMQHRFETDRDDSEVSFKIDTRGLAARRLLAKLSAAEASLQQGAEIRLRCSRSVVDAVLIQLDEVFDGMYAAGGRSSVPPETLLKATVLMALYSIRSGRAFCERLNYDLLCKWVPGHADRSAGVRRDHVHQEPRASA
jgi:hypothetical protein